MKKKLAALGLMVVMILSLVGCGQTKQSTQSSSNQSDNAKKVVIGFSLSNFNDKWLSYLLNAAQAESKKYQDATVIFVDAKNDPAAQMGQVENFIAQGVNAIIVNPVDTNATAPLTDAAKKANIPLITVNRPVQNPDDMAAFVGSDEIQAGILQMQYLGEKMGGKGNIAILRGDDLNQASVKRTAGVKQVIKEKYPDIHVVVEDTAGWDRAKAMSITENWIQSGKKFDAIVANNDEMAIGAVMALTNANLISKVLVAGIDATPDALDFMKKGTLAATVFQNANAQGQGSIDIAYKVAKGEKVDKNNYIPFELVTPDKVDQYIAKWK